MLIVGHRGAAGHAPENTLAAIARALELGADAVEVDVRRSADGELVLMHDADLERTLGRAGLLAEVTFGELRAWPVFGREPPTRLADACALLRASPLCLMVEVKEPGLEQALVDTLHAHLPVARYWVAAFDHAILRRVKALDGDIRTMALLEREPAEGLFAACGCDMVGLGAAAYTPTAVRAAQRAGLAVFVWTLNQEADIRAALALDVDGIISDFPERVRCAQPDNGGRAFPAAVV